MPGTLPETEVNRQLRFPVHTGKRIQVSTPEIFVTGAIIAPIGITIAVSSEAITLVYTFPAAVTNGDPKGAAAGFKGGAVTGEGHFIRDNAFIPGAFNKNPGEQLLQQTRGAFGGKESSFLEGLDESTHHPRAPVGQLLPLLGIFRFLALFGGGPL